MAYIDYGNPRYASPSVPIGRTPHGTPLDQQVTCSIHYDVKPPNVVRDRHSGALAKIGRFEGPDQLDIKAGSPVFVPRKRDVDGFGIMDGSAFSVFNGLPKWMNGDKLDVMRYHKNLKMVGFALDGYAYGRMSAADDYVDVMVKGIANFINGAERVLQPGELVTWVPNLPTILPAGIESKEKRIKLDESAIVEARIVPLDDVLKLAAVVPTALADLKITQEGFGQFLEASRPAAGGVWNPAEAAVRARSDGFKKIFEHMLWNELSLDDLAIGKVCAAVAPNSWGRLVM